MSDPFVNKVADSWLITLNLEKKKNWCSFCKKSCC